MPIKRKDRTEATNDNGTKPQFVVTADHEMFLQAFESEYNIVSFSWAGEYVLFIYIFALNSRTNTNLSLPAQSDQAIGMY